MKIRIDEFDQFHFLQQKLSEVFGAVSDFKCEKDLLCLLGEIDHAIHELNKRYKVVQRICRNNNLYGLLGMFPLGLAPFVEPEYVDQVLQFFGSLKLLNYFKIRKENEQLKQDLKNDNFYIMWRVYHAGNYPIFLR